MDETAFSCMKMYHLIFSYRAVEKYPPRSWSIMFFCNVARMMNPMSRQTGCPQNWAMLVGDLRSGSWAASCQKLARMNFEDFDIDSGLEALQENRLYTSDALRLEFLAVGRTCLDTFGTFGRVQTHCLAKDPRKYNNLHFLRALVFALGGSFAQTEATWGHLRAMGSGALKGTQKYDVFAHAQANECVSRISRIQGQKYTLEDLVCFCCLTHSQ